MHESSEQKRKPGKSERLKQGQRNCRLKKRTGNVTREWGTGQNAKGRVCPAQGFEVGARAVPLDQLIQGEGGASWTSKELPLVAVCMQENKQK